ncbi:hypothetical protein [Arthrobacter sp. N1]|uniref:hypothetical protein n=1 Tax=Arthrobacter sp. N1 TaxID=619291 RepID=UPI003BB205EE
MDVLNQLEESLGCKPTVLVSRARLADFSDLRRLIGLRDSASEKNNLRPPPPGIWPLISHHHFNTHNFFGLTPKGNLKKRTLMLLLAHHGVVASDPLIEVVQLWSADRRAKALALLNKVIYQIAEVESLILKGLMRFESHRPSFTDLARQEVLAAFNVDTNFRQFTYLIEAYEAAQNEGGQFAIAYAQDVYELYENCGQDCPSLRNASDAFTATMNLGQALIQLSWQFGVVSVNGYCDITVTNGLEKRMFKSLMDKWKDRPISLTMEKGQQNTRHFERLLLGTLPNIDAMSLSVSDAVALRKHRVFEEFRSTVTDALDLYERLLPDEGVGVAAARFAEKMQAESHRMQSVNHRSELRTMGSLGIPVALTAAATSLPVEFMDNGAATIGVGVAGMIGAWLAQTTRAKGERVAIRYCVELGR